MGKVLITGANGFVGHHLCRYLKTLKISYKAGVRKALNSEEFSYGDLTLIKNWSPLLQDCDSVVHLAARVHVMQEDQENPLASYRKVNTDSTMALAEAAKENGIKKFIYLSSIKVHGKNTEENTPFKLDDRVHPLDPYSISKFETENKLFKLHEPGVFEVIVIRPPLVYGPEVKGNLKNLMQVVRWPVPLPFASVNNQRSLVSVYNLCDLIATCLKVPQASGKVFLVSDDRDLSLKELVQKFALVQKRRSFLFPFPVSLLFLIARVLNRYDYAQRLLGNLQVDISQTKKILNWKPPFSFEETYSDKHSNFVQK